MHITVPKVYEVAAIFFAHSKHENFHFCHRSNPQYPVVFSTTNVSKIKDYYDATKPTLILFHGWLGSEDSSEVRNISGVYLEQVSVANFFL